MRIGDVVFMTPLKSVDMPKDKQALMRKSVELFRPVRQRTVRSETATPFPALNTTSQQFLNGFACSLALELLN